MDSKACQIVDSVRPARLLKIMNDPVKSAQSVKLIYTSDQDLEGITRKKAGKKYHYFFSGSRLRDTKEIMRCERLAIPPAWTNVWICPHKQGHLQATGFDAKNRKQYKYHPTWTLLRSRTKFYRLLKFGHALPKIRTQLEKDLKRKALDKRKVLALVVSLMEQTNIRIGNQVYEKLHGSFGLTTMKDKHVAFEGSEVKFNFKGKKGIRHEIDLKNRKLARAILNCKDIPGKELFQYYTSDKEHHAIDSGMVNQYLKEISGDDFTAKDFRTWNGTLNALVALTELDPPKDLSECKENIKKAIEKVATSLGNTYSVCQKYYVHPLLLKLYETDELLPFFSKHSKKELKCSPKHLSMEETIVLKILEAN